MYAKLYASILTSSVWSETPEVRVVWVTMLALADREGYVFGSPVGLARIAAVSLEHTLVALEKFKAEEEYSSDRLRSPEHKGRRIEEVPGGWRVLNYSHFRDLKDIDEQRLQTRDRVAAHRAAKKADKDRVTLGNDEKQKVTLSDPPTSPSTPEEKAPKRGTRSARPASVEEVAAYISENNLPVEAQKWWDHYQANGWKVGRNTMSDWKAAVRTWVKNGIHTPSKEAPVSKPLPSGDRRTGHGYAAADGSWFDWQGSRWIAKKPGDPKSYRDPDGYRLDGTHQMNEAKWTTEQFAAKVKEIIGG